jgi:hypothetical protein
LIIVRSVCWLVPVVFLFRIEKVFHVKSCVSAVIDVVLFVIYSPSFTTISTNSEETLVGASICVCGGSPHL